MSMTPWFGQQVPNVFQCSTLLLMSDGLRKMVSLCIVGVQAEQITLVRLLPKPG